MWVSCHALANVFSCFQTNHHGHYWECVKHLSTVWFAQRSSRQSGCGGVTGPPQVIVWKPFFGTRKPARRWEGGLVPFCSMERMQRRPWWTGLTPGSFGDYSHRPAMTWIISLVKERKRQRTRLLPQTQLRWTLMKHPPQGSQKTIPPAFKLRPSALFTQTRQLYPLFCCLRRCPGCWALAFL